MYEYQHHYYGHVEDNYENPYTSFGWMIFWMLFILIGIPFLIVTNTWTLLLAYWFIKPFISQLIRDYKRGRDEYLSTH